MEQSRLPLPALTWAALRSRGHRAAQWLPSLAEISPQWLAAVLAGCALWAGAVALFSANDLHRVWGIAALAGYLLAAAAALTLKSRGADIALTIAFCGALAIPLGWLAATGKEQPEVSVIISSARMLIRHGTPYQSAAALAAAHNTNAYDPYLPVMTLFGLPRALGGSGVLTDPRIWFGVAFVLAFGLALAVAGARDWIRWTALITVSPVIAFELAVGGTDVPVLALMCLGLALLWGRGQPGSQRLALAGVALGVAAAMKATAWPALVIAVILVLARDGKRAAATVGFTAVVLCAVLIGPVAIAWPGALLVNTISFPLGLTQTQSRAVSPLPGHLLAQTGHLGHVIAVVLLALAVLGIAAWLLLVPPRNIPAATWRLSFGLALMFTLAPATRFGYYLYPAGLLVWMTVAWAGRARSAAGAPRPPPHRGPLAGALSPDPALTRDRRTHAASPRTRRQTTVRRRPAGQ